MKHVIVAIDEDGNETIYVDGNLSPIQGTTVYATDIDHVAGNQPIQFSHVSVHGDFLYGWPKHFDQLLVVKK